MGEPERFILVMGSQVAGQVAAGAARRRARRPALCTGFKAELGCDDGGAVRTFA